jgi:hypothetical protein
MRALDLDPFTGTERILLDLLQQPGATHATHLQPSNLG